MIVDKKETAHVRTDKSRTACYQILPHAYVSSVGTPTAYYFRDGF